MESGNSRRYPRWPIAFINDIGRCLPCFQFHGWGLPALQGKCTNDESWFLREKAWNEVIPAAARKWAKISLGHEVQCDNAHRMWHVQGKQHAGAVSRVGTGYGENYWEYKDQAMVKRLIMENNAAQFWLMEDMPPMQEPLLSELGYLADAPAATQIWMVLTFAPLVQIVLFRISLHACNVHPVWVQRIRYQW